CVKSVLAIDARVSRVGFLHSWPDARTPSRASSTSRNTLGTSTPTKLPRHFFTFPPMKTVSTWLGFIMFTTVIAALLSGHTSSRSARKTTIGLLAGRERADSICKVGAARALDGGEFEHVAAAEQRRQVWLALAGALRDRQRL